MIQESVCDPILASERLRGVEETSGKDPPLGGRFTLFLAVNPGCHWQPPMICLLPLSPFLRGNKSSEEAVKKILDL